MPNYTRYLFDVETTVKIRTTDDREVGSFSTYSDGSADSDSKPLVEGIDAAVWQAADQARRHAKAITENEKEKIR